MQVKTLGELATYVGGRVIGDSGLIIKAVATLEQAQKGDITFLSNSKYTNLIKSTKAGAIITKEQLDTDASQIIVENPYYAITQIMILLYGHRQHKKCGISKLASIAKNARIGEDCHIQDFVSVGDNVIIGDGCVVYPGVFVGPDTTIGNNCIIYPNAVIYDDCRIGDRVIIQANATIGEDGYGFATHKEIHHKIPQIGRVIIEDDVEIGSGCAIERGAIDDTVIGCGSKLGDLVAIGHGTKIGPHCLVVAHTGIAGSATIGHHCVLGGQVGVVGHIKVGNYVKVGAQAGIINDIPDGQTIVGSPAIEASLAKRAYSLIQYLPQMKQSIRRLEKLAEKKDQSGKSDSD